MRPPIPPPLVDGVLYLDNSQMELATTCARQSYYYTVRRVELNRTRIALDFGGAFHKVLEFLYTNYGTAYRNAEQNRAVVAFAAAQVLDTPEDDYRSVSYLVDAVVKYLGDYPAEPFSIVNTPDGKPAVEVAFAMPIGTIDTKTWGPIKIVWTGKVDMMYRSRDRLGILDHKTTSMMGPQFFAEFEIAHQMYGYAAAAEYILGEACGEFTINALGCRKPTVKGKGVVYEFQRHIIPVTRALLDEWHDDTLSIIGTFLANCEAGYFPKETKWCVGKYGACQYKSVCSLNPEHRELAFSTSEFRKVTWNPLQQSEPSGK